MLSIEQWQLWSDLSFFPDAPPRTLRQFVQPQLRAWEAWVEGGVSEVELERARFRFSQEAKERARSELILFRSRQEVIKLKEDALTARLALEGEEKEMLTLMESHMQNYEDLLAMVRLLIGQEIKAGDPRYTPVDRLAHNQARELIKGNEKFRKLIDDTLKALQAGESGFETKRLAIEHFKNYLENEGVQKIWLYQVAANENIEILGILEDQNNKLLEKREILADARTRFEKLSLAVHNLQESNWCARQAAGSIEQIFSVLETEFAGYIYTKARYGSLSCQDR